VLGAAARGLPQLCLPIAADQFTNADIVASAGCGLSLEPEQVDPGSVHDAVRRLCSEERFSERAQQVAAEIAAMPEPAAVVPLVETLAEHRAS
jgi:UDP:flavonoid glycosyltransferase YjiC (YdhE family)